MTNEELFAVEDKAREEFGRLYCRKCIDRGRIAAAGECRSMGIYAGMYCDACWEKDGRNHDRQFDELDAGEHYDE